MSKKLLSGANGESESLIRDSDSSLILKNVQKEKKSQNASEFFSRSILMDSDTDSHSPEYSSIVNSKLYTPGSRRGGGEKISVKRIDSNQKNDSLSKGVDYSNVSSYGKAPAGIIDRTEDTTEKSLMADLEYNKKTLKNANDDYIQISKSNHPYQRLNSEQVKKRRLQFKSTVIVNIASGLDGCDDQLLPASFRAFETDLKFYPSMLGLISLMQTAFLSIFSPVWGYLSDRYSRKFMLASGTVSWGIVTISLALVSDFYQVLFLRGLNGVALGIIGPVSQSILADVSVEKSRGLTFGFVQFASCMGRLIGGVITTSVALLEFGSLKGWRVCFICVGGLSAILGISILLFLEEIPRQSRLKKKSIIDDSGGTGLEESVVQEDNFLSNVEQILFESMLRPTVFLVYLEGLFGTIPWSALSFNTMFFQYCNMTDVQAALITGGLLIGAGIGGLFGGYYGDVMHSWSSKYGRPIVGQLAMLGRVPLLVVAYVIIPKHSDYFVPFFIIAILIGLSCMAGVAVNRPILSDVVRPDHRGTIFAITVASEGCISALFGAPLVGVLAESKFGYQKTDLLIVDMPDELRSQNAEALASSLAVLTIFPWIVSFFLYGGLYFTYGKDQDSIRKLINEEYQSEEFENSGYNSITQSVQETTLPPAFLCE